MLRVCGRVWGSDCEAGVFVVGVGMFWGSECEASRLVVCVCGSV